MELMAMVDMVLDTVLTLLDMVMALDMATPPLVMVMDMVLVIPGLDMESVLLKLSQRPMLSMEHMAMADMVLDTVLTPLDMVMVLDMATPPLDMVMDMVLVIPGLDMESVLLMLSQRLMLYMELMDMVDMVLEAEHTLLDTALDMADSQPLVVGMDTMDKLFLKKQ